MMILGGKPNKHASKKTYFKCLFYASSCGMKAAVGIAADGGKMARCVLSGSAAEGTPASQHFTVAQGSTKRTPPRQKAGAHKFTDEFSPLVSSNLKILPLNFEHVLLLLPMLDAMFSLSDHSWISLVFSERGYVGYWCSKCSIVLLCSLGFQK